MKCKIYISDEGLGPVVRQRAIIEALLAIEPKLEITLQTKQHLPEAKRIINGINFTEKYNNISWYKLQDGSPDLTRIRDHFNDYNKKADIFVRKEQNRFSDDFIVSDFVYEAFEIGHSLNKPSFGVCHFTWDWFFSKLYPPPIQTAILDRFFKAANMAKVLYFPPFTPQEILNHYGRKAREVPFIIKQNITHKKLQDKGKFNILIIDSGARVLNNSIKETLKKLSVLKDFHFFVSSAFNYKSENVFTIDRNDLFIDYIAGMDLVIGRAGFNTISECIALRTPMLLLSEAMNPEMNENIINIKHEGLGSFISLKEFNTNLHEFLPRFIEKEYDTIKEKMRSHDFSSDGAKVIAEDMLNRL